MKLSEFARSLGYSLSSKPGRFGIEIETETKSYTNYPRGFLVNSGEDNDGHALFSIPTMPSWIAKTDNSLRNYGLEYVLKKPETLSKTIAALKEFGESTKDIEFLQDQPSCSVHVHMNFSGQTLLVLANFLTIWTLFENILGEFCGESRKTNLFALPIRVADHQIKDIQRMLTGIDQRIFHQVVLHQQNVKYSSLNLGCLFSLGSLESRSFRGSTDPDELIEWVQILNQMYEFSRSPGLTPSKFVSSYRDQGPEILSDVFGEYSGRLQCEGFLEMMERQEKYLFDLVTSCKNWETFGLSLSEPKSEKPKEVPTSTLSEILQEAYTTPIWGDEEFAPIQGATIDTVTIDEYEEDFDV